MNLVHKRVLSYKIKSRSGSKCKSRRLQLLLHKKAMTNEILLKLSSKINSDRIKTIRFEVLSYRNLTFFHPFKFNLPLLV